MRLDASAEIGTGHFMRCLTLADALARRGARVRVLSRALPEYLRALAVARGHEMVPLVGAAAPLDGGPSHARWLGTTQEADAAECARALDGDVWDWLVVDHYALDARWERALRGACRRVLAIDDLADRDHDCDLLLDQNLYADADTRYRGLVPAACDLALGPRFALLREEFGDARKRITPRAGPVRRVLVFFGADPHGHTHPAVEALAALGTPEVGVDVVIGASHPERAAIEAACAAHGFACHVQTDRMATLMSSADLAVGAGGAATWERCCLGLPTFAVATAENQVRQVADAAEAGLLYAPAMPADASAAMRVHLAALLANDHLRRGLSRRGMEAVDGDGTARMVGRMEALTIDVRPAVAPDSASLFAWRNHPTIRAVSRDDREITWDAHERWFAAVTADPRRRLLVGRRGETAVGVVRFDLERDEAEVSIYVAPGLGDRGLGRGLLRAAERWLADDRPDVRRLRAQVLGHNAPSQSLFRGAGYEVDSTWYSKRLA